MFDSLAEGLFIGRPPIISCHLFRFSMPDFSPADLQIVQSSLLGHFSTKPNYGEK